MPVYVAGWLFLPTAGEQASIGSTARTDSRGIRLAIGLTSLLILVLLAVSALDGFGSSAGAWPPGWRRGLVLIWRNAPPEEQATLRRLLEPVETAAGAWAQGELTVLNRELEDTNRGVVALYAEELDEKADPLPARRSAQADPLSNMSHEFRTPVNSILALCNLLLN